jgi:hypothetical protein
MAESKEVEGERTTKKGKPRKVGFIKMQVIPDLEAEIINNKETSNISNRATLITDDSTSYTDLKTIVDNHQAQVIPKEKIGEILPWVHLVISNSKRMLIDIHHKIKPESLQAYVNEFCYKFNRRYYGEALFDRLLMVSASTKNNFRYRIR